MEFLSKESLKRLKKLNNQKYRDLESDTFDVLLEGERLVSQVITYGWEIEALFLVHTRLVLYEKIVQSVKCPIYLLTEYQADIISETKNGQGVFAQITFQLQPIKQQDRLLYLNNITDPGNLGTIIRTAASFSIDGLILDENCCDPANSKVIRASMGAVFTIPIRQVKDGWLSSVDHEIFVSDTKEGVSINEFCFPKTPYILVVGSEGHGVKESIQNLATKKLHIPTEGAMESLNVAIATGIFLHKMSCK